MTIGGSSSQYLGARPHGESRSRAPSQGIRGESPLKLGGQGTKPFWSWSSFGFWTFNESHKFVHFLKIWKCKKIKYLCYLCKKNYGWPKTGGTGPKLGTCASPGPSLKPPLALFSTRDWSNLPPQAAETRKRCIKISLAQFSSSNALRYTHKKKERNREKERKKEKGERYG